MPKLTLKYSSAIAMAQQLGLGFKQGADQEAVYQALGQQGFAWKSKLQRWEHVADTADEPTRLLRIRVWTDGEIVPEAVDTIVQALDRQGYELLERSEPLPCRPPKQLEGRIYLTFQPPAKRRASNG